MSLIFTHVVLASYAIDIKVTEEEVSQDQTQDRSDPDDHAASYIAEANWAARLSDRRPGTEFVSKHPIPDFEPTLNPPRKRPLEEYMEIDPPEEEQIHLPTTSLSNHARQRSGSLASVHSTKSAPLTQLPSAILSRRSPSVISRAESIRSLDRPASVKSLPEMTQSKPEVRLDQHFLRRLSVASIDTGGSQRKRSRSTSIVASPKPISPKPTSPKVTSPNKALSPMIQSPKSIPALNSPIISVIGSPNKTLSRPPSLSGSALSDHQQPIVTSPPPPQTTENTSRQVMLADDAVEKTSIQDNTLFQFDDDNGMDIDGDDMILQEVASDTTETPIEESDSFQALVERLRNQTQKSKTLFNNRSNMAALHIHGFRYIAEEVVMMHG